VCSSDLEAAGAKLHLVRDALQMQNVQLRPWQAAIARDSGSIDIDGHIALLPEPANEVSIVNRTGRKLRGVVLWLPGGQLKFAEELAAGGRLSSSKLTSISHCVTTTSTTPNTSHFEPQRCRDELARVSTTLTDAWIAITNRYPPRHWFPNGTPVLLAQIDGGDGSTRDTNIEIEHNRLLIRVVGFGGPP
jgi:hypothetical protein